MKKIFIQIGRGVVRVGNVILRVLDSVEKADAAYQALPPASKEAAVQTFADVVAFVVAVESAAVPAGANFVLDSAALAAAKKLYADAVADIDNAKKVFAALGVSLPLPAPVTKAA